jgi:hypothetical protein
MLPRDLLDLGDLVDYITDLGYAAAAAGEFSLEANEYRAAYDRLYALYRQVASTRETIEANVSAILPEQVSPVIKGVGNGTLAVRKATSESRGGGLTQQVFALQASLATILNGMRQTYATTIGADHDGAQHLAGANK